MKLISLANGRLEVPGGFGQTSGKREMQMVRRLTKCLRNNVLDQVACHFAVSARFTTWDELRREKEGPAAGQADNLASCSISDFREIREMYPVDRDRVPMRRNSN